MVKKVVWGFFDLKGILNFCEFLNMILVLSLFGGVKRVSVSRFVLMLRSVFCL